MSMYDQIKDAVKEGSKRASLDELKKKGFNNVKVVDFKTINELIMKAVDSVIAERSQSMLDEERQKLQASAKTEFERLLKEQKKAQARAQQMEQAKAKLELELRQATKMISSEDDSGGEMQPGGSMLFSPERVKQVQEQLQKMTERQKTLLDKYQGLDEEKRNKDAEVISLKLKLEENAREVERLRARGSAAPSAFIEESARLKDVREDLTRRNRLLKHFCRLVSTNEYFLRQGRSAPPIPIAGRGVQVLIGDKRTARTGIKVRYEPGSDDPIIDFPEGEGPAVGPGGNGAAT